MRNLYLTPFAQLMAKTASATPPTRMGAYGSAAINASPLYNAVQSGVGPAILSAGATVGVDLATVLAAFAAKGRMSPAALLGLVGGMQLGGKGAIGEYSYQTAKARHNRAQQQTKTAKEAAPPTPEDDKPEEDTPPPAQARAPIPGRRRLRPGTLNPHFQHNVLTPTGVRG